MFSGGHHHASAFLELEFRSLEGDHPETADASLPRADRPQLSIHFAASVIVSVAILRKGKDGLKRLHLCRPFAAVTSVLPVSLFLQNNYAAMTHP
jgi:hypothetical protein